MDAFAASESRSIDNKHNQQQPKKEDQQPQQPRVPSAGRKTGDQKILGKKVGPHLRISPRAGAVVKGLISVIAGKRRYPMHRLARRNVGPIGGDRQACFLYRYRPQYRPH